MDRVELKSVGIPEKALTWDATRWLQLIAHTTVWLCMCILLEHNTFRNNVSGRSCKIQINFINVLQTDVYFSKILSDSFYIIIWLRKCVSICMIVVHW